MVGVVVGVGLFSAVLFFIDGSGASMTKRALAPLPLDIQRVLTAPLGGSVRLQRKLGDASVNAGGTTTVTLTVTNERLTPAHEVVVRDRPGLPLAYVPGSTALDGRHIPDVGGGSPFSQGYGGTGFNLGTVAAGASHRFTYRLKATRNVPSTTNLSGEATISTREAIVPVRANAPRPAQLPALADKIGRIPGVRAADPLAFVDMVAGSISARGHTVPGPVKLLSFDAAYQAHYPTIRMLSGAITADSASISAETARALNVRVGDTVALTVPGSRLPLSMRVGGITDLSRATPLFSSRQSTTLEKFIYVPYTMVVSYNVYHSKIVPSFERAAAARNSQIKSLPLEELDILLDRKLLNSDPGTALAQTKSTAGAIAKVAREQDFLIDNASNTLAVAKGDAAVAKRMFVFLGLPGAILAAVLTLYAGILLAEAQRRESALLRVRGADRHHLMTLLGIRTVAIAGVGSLLGVTLGFVSVLLLLGSSVLFAASTAALLQSATIGVVGGIFVTALALYLPGRRLIRQEINQELSSAPRRSAPGLRLLSLELLLVVGAVAAHIVALRLGAYDVPAGSVYEGRSISLPLKLLLSPIVAWTAGTLLLAHLVHRITARATSWSKPRFGRLLVGVLMRSITRRLGPLTGGMITAGLVVGLGTALACFATSYDKAKFADSRFLVGSDIRLTPNPTSVAPHPAALASTFRVAGTLGATGVVFSPQNAVLTSAFNEDVGTLAAIDPQTYGKVAAVQDSIFANGSTRRMLAILQKKPDGLLVNAALAKGLKIKVGDPVHVLLGRGTDQQKRTSMKAVGFFTQFPGAPKATDMVANFAFYTRTTGLTQADYYLVSASDRGRSGLVRAAHSLSALPHFTRRFDLQTSSTALDKDQSSLTALNVRGLLHLDSFYTFLMAATATAMFVFGLLLQRRREYVTLRAQGLQSWEVRRLVLAEAGISATLGTAIGMLIGVGMAAQFVHVLRPIFTLPPTLTVPPLQLAILGALVLGAAVLSSAAAALLISRLKPTELLREE
ncbi:MAG: FtsX-like permease family protein [Actinomycetota bacterium]|nr:FtsX-like permease family protein [Actinomycetota bacterium]